MSLKPKKKTSMSAKIGKKKIELKTTSVGGLSEHEVIVSEGKKKTFAFQSELDPSLDFVDAIRAWRAEVKDIASDFERQTKSVRLVDSDEAVLSALKEVWKMKKGSRDRVTAHEVEKHLAARLGIKEAVGEEVDIAIRRLEIQGIIVVDYHMGLPMFGPGIGNDPNKRLLRIRFGDE